MALAFLLDENLRGPLWSAILRHNATSPHRLDAVRVGDVDGPPLGIADDELLKWAETAGRILVTLDEKTLPVFLANHLSLERSSPGIFTLRPAMNLPQIVEFLVFAASVSDAYEWANRITYVP